MAVPAAPVIKVVGSLLGGLFGRKSEKKAAAAQREYDKPVNVRARYEEAGINPLLAFQGGVVGQSQPVASQNYMGAAIADASMIIADEMSKRKETQQLSQLQSMNARLQEKVQNLTLRPKVGGIYAGRLATPTMRDALGYGGSDAGTQDGRRETGEGHPFPRDGVSPFGGFDDYSADDLVTGPQASVKKDVPAFRLFGRDFYGSGLFSTGQQVEDAIGEGPLQWAVSPLLGLDALANGFYQMGGEYSSRKWKEKLIEGYSKPKPVSEYWTHPQTGFSAKRVKLRY